MAYDPIIGSIISIQKPGSILSASVSGTVNIGTMPGSVVAFQGTSPFIITGSVQASLTPAANQSVSGTVGVNIISSNASVIGAIQGSIATVIIGGSIAASFTPPANQSVSGAVGASIIGTVPTTQTGTWISSIVSTVPSSVLFGVNAQRNDNLSSFVGGNLTWIPMAQDSAGRSIIKPFSSEDGAIISYVGSVTSASVTLIKSSAVGLRNYITDFWVANTGSVTTLIQFMDGSTSIVGNTIAPATGGSNSPGIAIPIKTAPSQDLTFQAISPTSILYLTVKGYQAP